MRGGSLKKFKIFTPTSYVQQKGGTLFRFQHLTPPFNGTWDQIGAQRGAGLGEVFKDFKKGVGEIVKTAIRKRKPSELSRGVKRSAATAIGKELQRQASKRIKDIFGA